jgi:DNA topoisomerase-3
MKDSIEKLSTEEDDCLHCRKAQCGKGYCRNTWCKNTKGRIYRRKRIPGNLDLRTSCADCLEPHEYAPEWKTWALSNLPMIPLRFGIKVMNDSGIQKQFKVIETLMANADEVMNCGDAGQEGELIQRWVMQKALCKCPVKRLWISSLTEEAIREGFSKLKDQSQFQSLYEAGLSRAIGDWLLGMNATRLYTLKYGKNRQVLSIGRVQTPTLALIVNRQLEIENFKPEAYWELKTKYRDTVFSATKGRFSSVEEGTDFLDTVRTADFFVTDISIKKGTESAPRLFDLTSLQVECNKKFGLFG